MWINSCLNRLLTLIFPDRCVFCDKVLGYVKNQLCICPDCAGQLVFLDEEHTCPLCGCRISAEEKICSTCQTHPHFFDKAVSCLNYEALPRSAVLRFKFGGRQDYYRTFSALLLHRLRPFLKNGAFDAVVCPPLSERDLHIRGYNQSALLAQKVSAELKLPFMETAFRKIRETPKQSSLHYGERILNVENAFRLSVPWRMIRGKRFLLIDDVITTGATANSLAKILKRAGAAYVLAVTVAAAEPRRRERITAEDIKKITF